MQKTILITGGSGGIGRACARLLVENGHRVILVARGEEGLARASQDIPTHQILTIRADVTRAKEVDRMVAEALAWSDRIDVLINNAGAAFTGLVETFPVEQWQRLLDTNLTSVFLCCRALIPVMKRQGEGHIVNMASVASKFTPPEWAPYCATKFGLVGLSRALHEEVRKDGIRVTLLYPGSVDTPLWDTFPNNFKRDAMMSADDVARAVLYTIEQPRHIVVDELSFIQAAGLQ